MMDEPLPPPDDELPAPPPEMQAEVAHHPEIKVRRSGPLATLRRAITIFEKDLRTMAKHGLISSVIMAVFLGIMFSIGSYSVSMALSFDFGEGGGDGDGDGPVLPGGTETVPPIADAGVDITVDAGALVTLDASGSTDNEAVVYHAWDFEENYVGVELYGKVVTHRFMAAGVYDITLMVVDSSWNTAEDHVTVTVDSVGDDTEWPVANAGVDINIEAGTTVTLNGYNSTDNIGIANYTWVFDDIVQRTLYGETADYTFENAYNIGVTLIVRDDAGNVNTHGINVAVSSIGGDGSWPSANFETEQIVTLGATVYLDASGSYDESGWIVDYTWYIKHNATKWSLDGQSVSFTADEWGPYDILLAVRDDAGNTGTTDGMVIALPAGFDADPDQVSWTATPLGQDISFNLLTYAYGLALLTSVIFIGGLFAKGFAHEIQKGTIKVLFFGPVSVTSVIFSKLLYPIVVGPLFIYPLVFIGLLPFHQSVGDILVITTVSYLLAVLIMASAAYGSCLIYLAANRMVLKPTVVTRVFMYLSLVASMTVFEWLSFLLDMRANTDHWGDLYLEYGESIAVFSPFHQGGVLLSDLILGSGATMDLWVFAIPAILIVTGVAASHRLYPDLFSRE